MYYIICYAISIYNWLCRYMIDICIVELADAQDLGNVTSV